MKGQDTGMTDLSFSLFYGKLNLENHFPSTSANTLSATNGIYMPVLNQDYKFLLLLAHTFSASYS